MRSALDDRTTKAVIRDEALRLFAAFGPESVTVRQIAAGAGVSAGLVVHHFGSKLGLREAVDERVAAVFDELFGLFTAEPGSVDWSTVGTDGSVAAHVLAQLPQDSPIPAYLARLWLGGDEAGMGLFRRWFDASLQMMEAMGAAGVVVPSADPAVRAAFLMVNDLAVLVFRRQLTDVLGLDPLSPQGLSRWLAEGMQVYRGGLFAATGST